MFLLRLQRLIPHARMAGITVWSRYETREEIRHRFLSTRNSFFSPPEEASARARRLSVVNGIHSPRGRLAAVGAALTAASLTIRADFNGLSPKKCERSEKTAS